MNVHQPAEDELELLEHNGDVEQEQGLLGGWKERGAHDREDTLNARDAYRSRKRIFSWPVWIAIIASLLAVAIVGTVSLLGWEDRARGRAEEELGVQTNDYVLAADWDFHAPAQRREYHWTIRDQVHNPDGIYRPMILVNNQFPGPLIEVNEGDTIVVHVDNRAINATSLHWHGIYQNGTPHMDGTPGITGCPISPGGRFTYEFTVSGQTGTYWWHAHQGVQSSDGAHGPLIIHGRNEKELQQIAYDTDRILLISDHYHELSSALLWQYLKPDAENTEPVPISGVLNGRTVRDCDDFPQRDCKNTTAHVGIPRIGLAPNQKHRLRLINVGAFAEFQVQIDEHELAVTEVDGTDVEPQKYHRININPAQRYSVIVSTSDDDTRAFWFRARMITKCFTDAPKTLDPDVLAIVHYGDSHTSLDELPTSVDWEERLAQECRDMNTTHLRPVEAVSPPTVPDGFFYLRSNFEQGAYRLSRGVFNSSSWRPNIRAPTLFRTIDGLAADNDSFISSSSRNVHVNDVAFDVSREMVIQSTGIATIDILVSNFDDGNHPLHLHGYKYFVLAQGHGAPPQINVQDGFNLENLRSLYDSLDLTNPLRRDTASVEAFGWILLRIVADNPGAWAFHCHVSWHTEAGLLMQFLTRTDELRNMHVPQQSLDLCAANGIEKGMGPDDSVYEDLAK